ncbi:DNA-binding transcriptional regulator YbjK [Microbacterium sp. W4I4]|uniref:TetR/AcrR family transcriptional regulator n=1 Tax=Microbacterium sp. W4I4 TaxID=3042295 RepID=UPI002785694B|nr:TetR family transcriptional regulator [Microbacterium sp. W4I4]MDQ0615744.1 DNA-binding transcriptional regulator YbjK [Microbacterium sp. W4I4]
MSSIRQRALDAAVTLVGTAGVRALTHARVDAAASLPAGSTSNHFRTRAALISGVITWIAQSERTDAGIPEIHSPDDLIAALTQMIQVQSGPLAPRTRARYALFLEADAATAKPLREQRLGMEAWVRGILRELGGVPAEAQTSFLMATADGLLLHRLTVDSEAPITPVIARAVHSALAL